MGLALACGLSSALALALAPADALAAPPTPEARAAPETEPDSEKSEKPKKGKKPKKDPNDPNRLEWGVLPAVSYDIDLGLGFGALVSLARFHPDFQPYRWRLEILAQATVKNTPGLGLGLPFHNDYIKADFPGLFDGRLRINTTLRFRRFINQGWYGLGNASLNPEPWEDIDPELDPESYREARFYNRYLRTTGSLFFNARLILWDRSELGNDVPKACGPRRPERCPPHAIGGQRAPRARVAHKRRLELLVGTNVSYTGIKPYTGSKLDEDVATRDGLDAASDQDRQTVQRLLHGTDDHALLTLNLGLLYDTRDHEYTPTRGSFTELSGQLSPGVDAGLLYGHLYLGTSHFVPLYGEYLVLAVRGVLDYLWGAPPLYALGEVGVLSPIDGPGGGWSIRGVPRQRYFGKQKTFVNLELRSMLYRFNIKTQRFGIGAMAFFDAGRLWTDTQPVFLNAQNIDGRFSNIKTGVGGGLRLTWGETLVIRVDPAWSPSDQNFGFYLDVGQMF